MGERLPYKQEVTGSIPVPPTHPLRQRRKRRRSSVWLERCPVKAEAAGSSPVDAATKMNDIPSVRSQIEILKSPPSWTRLVRPCRAGDGIVRLSDERRKSLRALFDGARPALSALSFVPASGAASRMFARLASGDPDAVARFAGNIEKFAFFDDLKIGAERPDAEEIVRAALSAGGLGYSDIPKGLVKFHRYGDGRADAFEEHINAARLYSDGVHFTVSPRFPQDEKRRLEAGGDVSFSVQDPATDTVALWEDGDLVTDDSGETVFRPSGHGALLGNLNRLKADVIFISNIDNVSRRDREPGPEAHRKELAGLLVELSSAAPPERPVRVCGVIQNTGEPGGGPFWVRDDSGDERPQIVEAAQVDFSDPSQRDIWRSATHFNPVDMVCRKGGFDLARYSDGSFMVVDKTLGGRPIKALEMPGLWNGAMAGWETVFVEIPSGSFNPVKEVFDLLRPCHQDLRDE